jgi:hypothetical protein
MLKAIVQDDDIRLFLADFKDFLYPAHPLLIDSYHDRRKLPLYLQWFISNLPAGRAGLNYHETLGFAFVPAAQHGNIEFAAQKLDQIFSVGCFSGSTYRDVADRNYRYFELSSPENIQIEKRITEINHHSVKQREKIKD